jgi:flagella basal body P-ring formation protein FlgA
MMRSTLLGLVLELFPVLMNREKLRLFFAGALPHRQTGATLAGSALALVLAAAPAFAGQRVALKDDPSVAGAEVRLGDLFDNAGAASGVLVARASGPTLILDAGRVQATAAAHGLEWLNPNGYRELVVKTAASAPAPAAAAMPATETVRTPAPAAERMVEALTWAHDLSAGDLVRPEDVVWTKAPARLVPHDAVRDPDVVVGQAARRALREGAPAAVHDLAPPRVIRRDQDVEVVFLQDGIRLVLTGRALADAALGDPIPVLNTQSKKTIDAVASGPGQAVIGPAAEAHGINSLAALP